MSNSGFSNTNNNNNAEEKESRLSKYATCIRQMAATAPYKKTQLFNSPEFASADGEKLMTMSSKFSKLLETIHRCDAADMEKHGKLFKHFIFTDIRNKAYGGKAIGSFLAKHGFEVIFKAEKGFRRRKVKQTAEEIAAKVKPEYRVEPTKKLKITLAALTPEPTGSARVGLLQSSPLWQSQLGTDVRKKMLGIFNSRPDNIHGELIRVMILDSKFKEGIDLYDVKYVHLMEPAITEADLKQAVGRATRFCGQRGLHFVPNIGWPLDVFLYESEFANNYPFVINDEAGALFDAHAYMMAHSGIDLGLLNTTRELTVLAIKSAVDYDLTYKINNFKIQSEILALTDLEEAVVLEVNPMTGGAKVVPRMSVGDMRQCMPRANKLFPFTIPVLAAAIAATGVAVPKRPTRTWVCEHLTPEIMEELLARRAALATPPSSAPATPPTPVSLSLSPAATNANSVRALADTTSAYQQLFPAPKPVKATKADILSMPDIADFFKAHEAIVEFSRAAQTMDFTEFQTFIAERYAAFGWESPVVRNECERPIEMGKPVVFSKSQDFVRHYLTPASPFKGLLAWHSVGTGKTCTAVATATTTFEREGYSILWVTRNSLVADVWKNMFGAVCSIPIQEVAAKGKKLPVRLGAQKRMVSKYWFDPISYKTLQNALVPMKKGARKGHVNKLGEALKTRNGAADPLKRTFLVIDEVHKLLDGDLKASEMANFELLAKAIQHSYAVSGADSVKVLLMTATPITDNPAGLFKLLNLLIPQAARRFPDGDTFRERYTDADGSITPAGVAFFQDRAKGLISYLNREFDPSTFSQPRFHPMRIPVSGAMPTTDAEMVAACWATEGEAEADELDCDVDDLKGELAEALDALAEEDLPKKELAERKRTLKADYKTRMDACKEKTRKAKQAGTERKRRLGACISTAAKTRKKLYTVSQQKATRKCFGKSHNVGAAPKFTGVADLKKLVMEGPKPMRQTHINSAFTTRAVRLTGTNNNANNE